MKFTVLWLADAERELTELWLDFSHRQAVAIAAQEIERRLCHDPDQQGESRGELRRILLVPPLGVTFEVSLSDRLVQVLDVWRFEQH